MPSFRRTSIPLSGLARLVHPLPRGGEGARVTAVRRLSGVLALAVLLLALVVVAILAAALASPIPPAGPAAHSPSSASFSVPAPLRSDALVDPSSATSIVEVGPAPAEGVVGVPIALVWQAFGPGSSRVTTFAVGCELTVTDSSNGSSVRAWVNASTSGALHRASNGTFTVPTSAWNDGALNVTVSVGSAVPATVRLFGSLLPNVPSPVGLMVLPDLDHLVLYEPGTPILGHRTNDTFWHVRDRFGDPTPGAFLIVEYSTATSVTKAVVPVNWTSGGATGAWVNYSAPGTGNGTVRVADEANSTLLGPISIPAVASPAPTPASVPASSDALSPLVVLAILLLAAGGILGMAALSLGGRTRPAPAPNDGEEELRRLAEGRETVVEILRRAGPLGIAEIEAAWEPLPAPPAVADWVASLVTDGTLTAALGEDGRARFSLAERPVEEPKVTFDEAALDREIARRDAAVVDEDEKPPE